VPQGTPVIVAGQWGVQLEYQRGSAAHTFFLEQDGSKLVGTHQGEFYSGDLTGTAAANTVHIRSSHPAEGTRLSYEFTGTVEGDTMAGKVSLGEYGEATWKAQRHQYRNLGHRNS